MSFDLRAFIDDLPTYEPPFMRGFPAKTGRAVLKSPRSCLKRRPKIGILPPVLFIGWYYWEIIIIIILIIIIMIMIMIMYYVYLYIYIYINITFVPLVSHYMLTTQPSYIPMMEVCCRGHHHHRQGSWNNNLVHQFGQLQQQLEKLQPLCYQSRLETQRFIGAVSNWLSDCSFKLIEWFLALRSIYK